jgi:Fe-S cluster assembly iron-binding protein IscA
MIQITDTARDKLREILDQNSGKLLRIFVQGAGWGGPRMGMALDEPEENEQPVQVNGIDVLIADFARPLIESTTVDYIKESQGEGFVITGANSACWDRSIFRYIQRGSLTAASFFLVLADFHTSVTVSPDIRELLYQDTLVVAAIGAVLLTLAIWAFSRQE